MEKSLPFFNPFLFKCGIKISSQLPGLTVLVITIKCLLFFFFVRGLYILFRQSNINLFEKEPSLRLGVGSTIKVIFVSLIRIFMSVSYLKLLLFLLIYLLRSGSISLKFLSIFSFILVFKSYPITLFFFEAKKNANGNPNFPKPMTEIFI